MTHSAAHLDTLDDVSECGLLVVGCGNLLRADDGVGPILVRHLWEGGVPAGVRLVDGGTAGRTPRRCARSCSQGGCRSSGRIRCVDTNSPCMARSTPRERP